MPAQCPKCKTPVKAAPGDSKTMTPVVVCPKCKNLIFVEKIAEVPSDSWEGEPETGGFLPKIHSGEHRKYRRYFILMTILLICFLTYQLLEAIRKSELIDQARNVAAKSVLYQLAAVQEAFYIDNNIYADHIDKVRGEIRLKPGVVLTIINADAQSWEATSYHLRSTTGYIGRSSRNGPPDQDDPQAADTRPKGEVTTSVTAVKRTSLPGVENCDR